MHSVKICLLLLNYNEWPPISLFFTSFTLAALGYIGPGDAETGGDLPLGQGHRAAQAVPQADDLRLPGGKAFPYQLPQTQSAVPVVEIFQHGVVHPYHVHQLQGVALFVCINGVGQGDLPLQFLLTAKIHQDLIRYPLLTDT